MFKSARWRGEKNRIKEVFKLQFHATQVSQQGVDALTVSLVPADVGKPTLRLEKAVVRDGTCRWENPAYETVKFVREPKTGKISERIYHFIVSSGSSKAGQIGEVTIDFADYADATKPSTLSLPLKNRNLNSNIVLHVLIRRVQDTANERDTEGTEDVKIKSKDRSLKSQFSFGDEDDSIKSNYTEDDPFNKTSRLNDNCRASSGSDITLSSSETSSGLNTPRELALRNNIQPDPTSFLSSLGHPAVPSKPMENASSTVYEEHQKSQWEWSDGSQDTDDSTHSSQDTHAQDRSQQASDDETEKLKAELALLARQADVTELELQTLRKHIVKENKRGRDLSREVVSLREERNALEAECERLKAFEKCYNDTKAVNKLQAEGGDALALLEEIRQELNHEKDQNANLRIQLQKTQESNAELILAVKDLDEMLEQKEREISNISDRSGSRENTEEFNRTFSKCETDDDEEQKALEELVKEHTDARETYMLEQKIVDLYNEIEIYRREKEELEMQMEQLALDYEILKQENHDMSYRLEQNALQEQLKVPYECSGSFVNLNELENQVESLEKELQKQSNEFSDSLATINKLEAHIKSLEEELGKQAQGFEADMEALMHAKVEQEQRAIQAEETLRKTKWKNANTAERLQEEFRRLSTQMASTFEANEKVAMKALTEAGELRMQKIQLEEMLRKANEELQATKDDYEVKLLELSNLLDLRTNQIEQMLEDGNKSKQLERHTKHEEEASGALSQEILSLKSKVDRLTTQNNFLAQQDEERQNLWALLEKMKISIEETELLVQRGNVERAEVVSTISLLRKEADKSLEELNSVRHHKKEKGAELEVLQSELRMLQCQCNDGKDSLFEDELEKEKLRKQVFQLKGDLKKKDDAFTVLEKKVKDHNGRPAVPYGTKTTPGNNKAVPVPCNLKEVESMREKIKFLRGHVKSKEAAFETSTNLFLEKEEDLQKRIEELESTMEQLNQNSATSRAQPSEKVEGETGEITSNRGTLFDELLTELASLKERNNSMEIELKEMQERYSEISLKFAEVEGERQQLVMTVRNLKNANKSK